MFNAPNVTINQLVMQIHFLKVNCFVGKRILRNGQRLKEREFVRKDYALLGLIEEKRVNYKFLVFVADS